MLLDKLLRPRAKFRQPFLPAESHYQTISLLPILMTARSVTVRIKPPFRELARVARYDVHFDVVWFWGKKIGDIGFGMPKTFGVGNYRHRLASAARARVHDRMCSFVHRNHPKFFGRR